MVTLLAILLTASVVVHLYSRIYLANTPRSKGWQIEALDARQRNVPLAHLLSSTLVAVCAIGIIYFIYDADVRYWRQDMRGLLLFPPLLAALTIAEALFALRTNAFPMSFKLDLDSFVYDPHGKLRHVAHWQIRLALLLLLLDLIVYLLVR